MKKKLLLFAAFLSAVVSFTSCSKDEYNSSNIFTSDYEEYGVSKDQQTLKIDFKSSCKEELEIVNFSNWLNATIVKSNSSLYVTFSDNSGDYARTAEIIIQTKDETGELTGNKITIKNYFNINPELGNGVIENIKFAEFANLNLLVA